MQAMYEMLGALAEPNRLHIVEFLLEGPRSVGEIVKRLRLSQPQVSKHLAVLSRVGLVKMRPTAQKRIYALESKPFRDLDSWLDSYRVLWSEKFDRLDTYLAELQMEEAKHAGKKHR